MASQKQLEEKLSERGVVSKSAVQQIVRVMTDTVYSAHRYCDDVVCFQKLLDDVEFAAMFATSRWKRLKWSMTRIRKARDQFDEVMLKDVPGTTFETWDVEFNN